MMLSSSAVDRVLGIQTDRLIALGLLESGRPGCGPRGSATAKKEGQRDRRHGGREEERGTPIHRS
jgi:hypothetical protein